jgi:hypothetical protein
MACEALRTAGGEFVPDDLGQDSPNDGDRVWGQLVTIIAYNNNTWSDAAPANLCVPGDVIQFGWAAFPGANYPSHFTAVVAAVNSSGRPTSIFQQNFGGNRVVQQSAIDTTTLNGGWMRIYRPLQRTDRFNEWKFTIVNNSSSQHRVYLYSCVDLLNSVTLSAANSSGSYQVFAVTTDGTVPNFLLSNGFSFFVETPKGNQLLDSDQGVAIQQLD